MNAARRNEDERSGNHGSAHLASTWRHFIDQEKLPHSGLPLRNAPATTMMPPLPFSLRARFRCFGSMRPSTRWIRAWLLAVALTLHGYPAHAQNPPKVVDIPTRPGVTQRFLFIAPDAPKAAAILYAGGHGGLQLESSGRFGWGAGNFLVRSRQMFVNDGIAVAVIDAPSDRQSAPYLDGFRLSKEHADDARAVIAWLKEQLHVPVWLVGTSRGTQSAAAIAIALAGGGGPDGLVLTSTILREEQGGTAVTDMNLASLTIPVLVVHHQNDGCKHCPVSETDTLLKKLEQSPKAELMIVSGGRSQGGPCEASAYHGFNGLESGVVDAISAWMLAR
ncbi:alpha/beta hydrolase [Burkholderia lata]|uniref:alpha/beta hydrolase n=1 Tax=Burkholderia lata (strain ATCC 17760 / DSM 23089 / LMG 22485 / NCIMB 9086 / R18194 / 383) TaxID=482957 RepID=UPI001E2EF804|nr:alpha/beta hydrolase [Burkholderia lata]